MRILNRPMFRYGGPIKEGVMHGMRDGGRTIAGGHQIGTPMGNRTGFADPTSPGFWARFAANYAPKNLTPKKLLSRILPWKRAQAAKYIKPAAQNLQGIFVRKATTPGITSSGAGQTFLQNLKSFPGVSKIPGWATKAKNLALTYPKSTAAAGYFGALPIAASLPYKKIGSTLADVAKWPLSFLPGGDDDEGGDGTDTITKKIIGTGDKPWEANVEEVIDPDAAKKLAVEEQNERLKSYLDMMGYDSAKRGALDKALIDASALVQDATTEAGSLKHADWGKLINKAIQTTSKRLDKPEQIREAVGLMMTKGAIEKDIADAKGTALDIKEKAFVERLGEVAGKRGALGKPSTLSEAVNATKATDGKGDRTNQALRSYYDGYLTPNFKSKLSSKKIKELGGEDIFKQDGSIELGDGVYQVSNSYIIVQGKKIIELADVFGED